MIKKTIKFSLLSMFLYLVLSCQSQRIILTGTLPDEDKLPKPFNENIIKHKAYFYEHPDSVLIKYMKIPEENVYNIFENDKEYTSLDNIKFWTIFNYKTGIKELIKRITNTKEIGLVGAYDLVINGRVENGDMPLDRGKVIDNDLFKVAGRASYLLKEITGEDFGSAGMYATNEELIKLQRKWIKWYNSLSSEN
jgi:hypothetical protein